MQLFSFSLIDVHFFVMLSANDVSMFSTLLFACGGSQDDLIYSFFNCKGILCRHFLKSGIVVSSLVLFFLTPHLLMCLLCLFSECRIPNQVQASLLCSREG